MRNLNQILSLLLILLFLSCDALDEIASSVEEGETDLDDSYYVEEGWSAMDSEEYLDAINFFEYLLGTVSDVDLLIQANHGFAWAKLFYSTTSLSNDKKSDRTDSYDSFFMVEEIISQNNSSINGQEQIECDIYAGKILYSDYMIYYYQNLLSNGADIEGNEEQQRDYYSLGEVSGNDLNQNGHIELGLYAIMSEMEQVCPDYDTQNYIFDHSISIDINDLRLIVAKDYIRRGEYVSAKSVINDIIDSLESTSITFILNNESSLSDGAKRVIGDFEFKTIDNSDVYELEISDNGDYFVDIHVTQLMPCNFNESFDDSDLDDISELRDELFECVNGYNYFNSNSSKTFKYRFVDGDYDSDIISNQESSLPSSCSSSDSYRSIEVPYNSFESIILEPACFNSCSSSCD